MRLIILFVAIVVVVVAGAGAAQGKAWSWFDAKPECNFSRSDALTCIERYVDIDPKDGTITLQELEAARAKYSTRLQKAGSWVASWFTNAVSTERIVKDCDYNKDGVFTMDDFYKATKTCMPTQHDLCVLRDACNRAREQE